MNETIYNNIGKNYSNTRSADPRIVAAIKDSLGLDIGSVIADIGAGTGSYSNALAFSGYKIKAIEPSD